MSYTITNNIMYVRDSTGNLVPVSMVAPGADQSIQAINNATASAIAQIDTKLSNANTAIEEKTDEQVSRIPEVTALAENVTQLKVSVDSKLTEPAEGLAVGKYFRVAAIDENGHAVLEAVDAPADGHTPIKGTDYFTEADKAEMVNAVLTALPAAEGVSY